MDAVTYPQSDVVTFVNDRVVPLRLRNDAAPYAEQFRVKWTPCLVALDAQGEEHYRTVGFLPPEELIPSLILREGRIHFDADRQKPALRAFDEVIERHAGSRAAPEATYYRGVARYKDSGDPQALKQAYEKLAAEHADSVWAQRAGPYRLL